MMLDEPTRGVDIGAKAEIYRLLFTTAERGIGILVSSSETGAPHALRSHSRHVPGPDRGGALPRRGDRSPYRPLRRRPPLTRDESPATRRRRRRALERAEGVWSAGNRYAAVLLLLIGLFVYFSLSENHFFTQREHREPPHERLDPLGRLDGHDVRRPDGGDRPLGRLAAGPLGDHPLEAVQRRRACRAWLAIICTILIAGAIGASINGVLIGRVGLSFFVVTLGTLSLYEGIVNIWSNTQTTYI